LGAASFLGNVVRTRRVRNPAHGVCRLHYGRQENLADPMSLTFEIRRSSFLRHWDFDIRH
jgi:hypothetical protein